MSHRRRRRDLEEQSRHEIARSELIHDRLAAQWPEVTQLTEKIRRDQRENHVKQRLRQAFGQPRERWRRRWA